MTKAYVDSSIVLGALLQEPSAIDWHQSDGVVSSELLRVEILRTLDRLRVQGKLLPEEYQQYAAQAETELRSIETMPLTRTQLRQAALPVPLPLGTLDAIHLASARLWIERRHEPLILLTHDRQLAAAAQAFGLEVRP